MPMVQARNPIPHTSELPEGHPDVSGRPDPAVGAIASPRQGRDSEAVRGLHRQAGGRTDREAQSLSGHLIECEPAPFDPPQAEANGYAAL